LKTVKAQYFDSYTHCMITDFQHALQSPCKRASKKTTLSTITQVQTSDSPSVQLSTHW
jgi:hypothetical protein